MWCMRKCVYHTEHTVAHYQNNIPFVFFHLEDTFCASTAIKYWGIFQWKHILGSYICLFIKQSRWRTVHPHWLFWTHPLWDFFTKRFLLNPKQTKNRRSQFITARITPEVLTPHRLQIKLIAMPSFFSYSRPCGQKMTLHSRCSQQNMSSVALRLGNWTGNKIHFLSSWPFL